MEQLVVYFVSFVFVALASQQIGKYFSKFNLPYITGYLLAGMVAGPFILGLLPEEAVADLRFIDELSLAVIAFVAGSELYLKELQGRIKTIVGYTFGILLAASLFGGVAIFILTSFIPFTEGMSIAGRIAVAVLGATILMALSPASTIAVIKEVRAKGPFTRTVLGVTVSMDVVIIVFFAVSASIAAVLIENTGLNLSFVLVLALDLIIAVLAGIGSGKLLELILSTRLNRLIKTTLVLALGLSIFVISFELVDISKELLPFELHPEPLLISMIAGFWVTNYSAYREEFDGILHDVGPLVYVAFFTLTGIALKLDVLLTTLPIAAALFVVRAGGIFVGSYAAGTVLNETPKNRRIAWMSFITQAGIALGLAREVAIEFPSLGNEFATMIIAVVVLNEIFGPLFLKSALRRAGETNLPDDIQRDETRDALVLGVEPQSLALARQLKTHNWCVILADTDPEHVARLQAEDVDERHIPAINRETMASLLTPNTDALVAMLDDDNANYIACELAYDAGIHRIIVRPNDITRTEEFKQFGAYIVDSGTAMISLLDQYVRVPQTAQRLTQRSTDYEIVQVTITNPDVHKKMVRDLRLANDVLILEIQRDGTSIVPHGYHVLHLKDEVTLIGKPESLDEVTLKLGY